MQVWSGGRRQSASTSSGFFGCESKSTGLRDAGERGVAEAVAGADSDLPSLSAGASVRATGRTVVSNALTLSDLEQSPISPKAFDILVTSGSHVFGTNLALGKVGHA